MQIRDLGVHWSEVAPPLPPALGAPRVNLDCGGIRVSLYLYCDNLAGSMWRAPLLLVHGMGVGSSAMDMRPLFEHFANPPHGAARAVAALELPGFGSSQRDVRTISPAEMADAIVGALQCLQERGLSVPADICALGLSCEFAACAALKAPGLVRSLALISPSGLEGWRNERYDAGRTRARPALRKLLRVAAVGELLFRSLSTRASMRQQHERLWDSPLVDEALLDYSVRSARCDGARHVPLELLCGALSTRGVIELYRQLELPVWVGHGMRGAFSNLEALGHLGPNSAWTRQAYDTGAMPHFEHQELFCAQYGAFLRDLDQPAN